jgi:NAD+ diphosphatase
MEAFIDARQPSGYALFCGPDLILPPSWEEGRPGLPVFGELPLAPDGAEAAGPAGGTPAGAAPAAGTLAADAAAALAANAYGALFHAEGRHYVAVEVDEGAVAGITGARRLPTRQYIGAADEACAAFALKAAAYAHWAYGARRCSFCGAHLVPGHGRDDEGARVCPSCGRAYFPRISPAVIVLVSRGDEMLLAHNAKFPSGRHGLIAGFVEPGETLEETVRREVMEEAGIEIGEPRYLRSQPWPFPDSLMLAFEAEYRSGEARPDGAEIDSLGWFSPDALPDIPPRGSVARSLIERFIDARKPARS